MSASTTGRFREVTLSTSGSVLNLADFQNDNAMQKDLLLNAPTFKLRGSAQVDNLGIKNAFARVDGRYHNAYAFESGYWNSMALLGGKLPSRVVVDMTVGYRLPDRHHDDRNRLGSARQHDP